MGTQDQKIYYQGSCLCGAVRFDVLAPLENIGACHCVMCRKLTGHYFVSGRVADKDFRLTTEKGLSWYQSSDIAQRGFCKNCGSQLFYRPHHKKYMEICPGSIDGPTDFKMKDHIYVSYKGDYYDITDGLPQYAEGGPDKDE